MSNEKATDRIRVFPSDGLFMKVEAKKEKKIPADFIKEWVKYRKKLKGKK